MDSQPVSFYQINFLARTIAKKFKKDKITHVIGLARGGLIPATIISYELEVPLLSYAISSYNHTTKTDKFKINQFIHFNDLKSPKEGDPHVLVVDDICDTGDTMDYIQKKISSAGIKAKYTTLFTKKKHRKFLDQYGVVISKNTWIEFPWE
jgi:hypoxanthine phosphoribosyltransferase|tara:strand:- start:1387 stop:1839 length:453 start_codon:yes stop_codon:yes gene_type:complete